MIWDFSSDTNSTELWINYNLFGLIVVFHLLVADGEQQVYIFAGFSLEQSVENIDGLVI